MITTFFPGVIRAPWDQGLPVTRKCPQFRNTTMPIGYGQVFLYIPFSCQSCAAGNVAYTSTKDHLGYCLTPDAG